MVNGNFSREGVVVTIFNEEGRNVYFKIVLLVTHKFFFDKNM